MRTIDDQPADKLKAAGRLDGARGHMLMPSAVKSKIPRMRAQEDVDDPVVYAKFFSPYSGAVWLITEFDGSDEMFGWADLGFGMGELGYISLRELENSNKQGLPLVERDTSFRPMPLSKAKRQNRNASLTKKAKLVRIAMKRAKADPEFRRKLVAAVQKKAKSPEAVMTWLKLIKNSVDVAGFPPRAHSQVASAILDMAKMLPRDKAWQGDLNPLIAAAKALKSKADKRMNAQVKNMHPDSERRA